MSSGKQKPKQNGQSITPDLPEMLASAIDHARQLVVPTPTEEEEVKIPNLFAFLTPRVVLDPRYKGEGKAPRVLREPLLLLSWDRRAGAFKVSLSDKVLNLSGSISAGSLIGALHDTETLLAAGRFPWSERKVT